MSINWNWKEKCAEMNLHTEDGNSVTVQCYTGNCLLIMLHEWDSENGDHMYQLWSFWADKAHMDNCLGLAKGTSNIYGNTTSVDFVFDRNRCRNWKYIVPALIRSFGNVRIETRCFDNGST